MKKYYFVFLVISLFVISGCSSQSNDSTGNTVNDNQGNSQDNTNQNIAEFNVIAKDWEFNPGTITVKKGDLVKLHVKSIDVTHGIYLPDFDVNGQLKPGETVDIEFTADKVGTFTFKCNVPCGEGHKEMTGIIIVEE